MTTKHTPGPWSVHNDAVLDSTGRVVACAYPTKPNRGTAHKHGTMGGNLNIIAAAPELLAALKAMVGPDGDLTNPDNYLRAVHAIAKAEGREP